MVMTLTRKLILFLTFFTIIEASGWVLEGDQTSGVTLKCHNKNKNERAPYIVSDLILYKLEGERWKKAAIINEQRSEALGYGYVHGKIDDPTDAFLKLHFFTTPANVIGMYKCQVYGYDKIKRFKGQLESTQPISISIAQFQIGVSTGENLRNTQTLQKQNTETQGSISKEIENILENRTLRIINKALSPILKKIQALDFSDRLVTWPSGRYWLPRPKLGCPTSLTTAWQWGYFVARTRSRHTTVDYSPNLMAKVTNEQMPLFLQEVCSKVSGETEIDWPKGSYCIGSYDWNHFTGACPPHFQTGRTYYSRYEAVKRNVKAIVINQVGIEVYFCCRNDQPAATPMILPTQKPFYLYRYNGMCQTVAGMHYTVETVKIARLPHQLIHPTKVHIDSIVVDSGYAVTFAMCYYTPMV